MSSIYALVDPRTDAVRYVGQTRMTLKARLSTHVRYALKNGTTHCACWIRNLAKDDLVPMITLIESGDWDQAQVDDREIYWIAKMRVDGCDLTNHGAGGGGARGMKQSPETCERVGAASRAHWADPAGRASHIVSIQRSWERQDLRDLMGAQSRERWADPNYKTRITLQSEEYRARRSAIAKEIATRKRQCADCGHVASPLNMARHLNFYKHSGYVAVQNVEV